jgi:hypothetical protein
MSQTQTFTLTFSESVVQSTWPDACVCIFRAGLHKLFDTASKKYKKYHFEERRHLHYEPEGDRQRLEESKHAAGDLSKV